MSRILLVANPGSASRKYALFEAGQQIAKLHFEYLGNHERIACTLEHGGGTTDIPVDLTRLDDATEHIVPIFEAHQLLDSKQQINAIGLRVVAPGSYFLSDHVVDDDFLMWLQAAHDRAPLHITATINELDALRRQFPGEQIIGVSDSAFHITKPERAWNYGIPLQTADTYDIKRFGYHGLSVASVIRQTLLPHKVIVCHLGSGASITAVHAQKSIDTTMGYSPLEGLIMSTRSGSIDASAISVLRQTKQLDDHALETYLNTQSGLLGLGGSADVRELLEREQSGDPRATLALDTFVYTIQKGIGSMAAALNGVDALVLTGTIGERSSPLRMRIVSGTSHLGFEIDTAANTNLATGNATPIQATRSKPILVIPTQEEQEIAQHMLTMLSE